MDYGKVLGRAWEITWRWKVLWILGFLASLGSILNGGSSFYRFGAPDVQRWSSDIQQPLVATAFAAICGLACVALLVAIALAIVSIMAQGGLIAGAQQIEEKGSTSFRQAWRVGRDRFWTLFGIRVLVAVPVLVFGVVLGIAVALTIVGASQTGDNVAALGWGEALAALCGCGVCCGLLIVSAILGVIQVYADRAAILEGLGWIAAFKRGWEVLKANLGPTLVLWLLFMVVGLVTAAVIFGVLAAIGVPLFIAFSQVQSNAWIWMLVPLVIGGLIALVVGALISSVWQTFCSSVWTLAYRQLTGAVPPAAEMPAPPEATTQL